MIYSYENNYSNEDKMNTFWKINVNKKNKTYKYIDIYFIFIYLFINQFLFLCDIFNYIFQDTIIALGYLAEMLGIDILIIDSFLRYYIIILVESMDKKTERNMQKKLHYLSIYHID